MISSFKIQNFKSFEDAELKLGSLTLLIGANASGKSNAIEAIRFLNWLAVGRSLDTLSNYLKHELPFFRGKIDDLFLKGKQYKTFSLGCITEGMEWDNFSISFRNHLADLWIQAEDFSHGSSGESLYKSVGSKIDFLRVSHTDFKSVATKTEIRYSSRKTVFSQIVNKIFIPINELNNYLQDPCTMLQFQLQHIYFFDSLPTKMRGYSNKSDTTLSSNAENISSVLYYLLGSSNSENELVKIEMLNLISSLPEQNISDIRFWETGRGEVMVKLVESFGGKETEIDAPLLSDGTLRVLAIAAALLCTPKGSLVVIEEIDNGVHPSRAKSLLNSIKEIAKRRKLKVLISSHNPALMDALPDSSLGDTVFCYRDPKSGFSKLQRLSDLFDYPELIVQGSLGDLVTEGILDRFVKNHPGTREEKIKRSLAWLESIR